MILFYPLDKIYITQKFGDSPEVYKQFGLKGHDGIDFRTRFIDSPLGRRYVTAANDGVVDRVEDQGKKGYGLHIRIKHADGSITIYGHLTTSYIEKGQTVARKQQIALSGNSGFSSAPHLHFEYRPANADVNNGYAGAVDPMPLLLKGAELDALQANPPDTELEEITKWIVDNGLAKDSSLPDFISKQDMLRILYRYHKKLNS